MHPILIDLCLWDKSAICKYSIFIVVGCQYRNFDSRDSLAFFTGSTAIPRPPAGAGAPLNETEYDVCLSLLVRYLLDNTSSCLLRKIVRPWLQVAASHSPKITLRSCLCMCSQPQHSLLLVDPHGRPSKLDRSRGSFPSFLFAGLRARPQIE